VILSTFNVIFDSVEGVVVDTVGRLGGPP